MWPTSWAYEVDADTLRCALCTEVKSVSKLAHAASEPPTKLLSLANSLTEYCDGSNAIAPSPTMNSLLAKRIARGGGLNDPFRVPLSPEVLRGAVGRDNQIVVQRDVGRRDPLGSRSVAREENGVGMVRSLAVSEVFLPIVNAHTVPHDVVVRKAHRFEEAALVLVAVSYTHLPSPRDAHES
eukprot:858561-Prymnesium_polylepis.2